MLECKQRIESKKIYILLLYTDLSIKEDNPTMSGPVPQESQ